MTPSPKCLDVVMHLIAGTLLLGMGCEFRREDHADQHNMLEKTVEFPRTALSAQKETLRHR